MGLPRALFILTIFLSSGLLFLVQPMVARMILPVFGGSPAVWTASNLFFQAFLLLGYAYAHWSTRLLGVKRQPLLHLPLMALALLTLPFAIPTAAGARGAADPTTGLLVALAIMIGLPFFATSAGAPLIQRWFSVTSDKSARDPYFLYSASNLASLLALFAYPILLEPRMRLADHARVWAGGYIVLVLLMGTLALLVWRSKAPVGSPTDEEHSAIEEDAAVNWQSRLLWIALAAAPSSLLLGVTAFMTTNVAPVPMLWVVPLSLYLLTYILAFAKRQILSSEILGRAVPLLAIPLALMIILGSDEPIAAIAAFHLIAFFALAWMCHARLNETRPPTTHLTEFYLWISVGGVMGGIFNAIIAPHVFASLAEYPIAIVAALMLRPKIKAGAGWLDLLTPVAVAAVVLAGLLLSRSIEVTSQMATTLMTLGIPLILCIVVVDWPVRFALAVGAVFFMAQTLQITADAEIIAAERSFFGVHRVTRTPDHRFYRLLHGNTIHGVQDRQHSEVPLTYYHPTGPAGQVFEALKDELDGKHVGLVGLGVGSLAAYGQPGQRMTFFEIDPIVRELATNSSYFTFLSDSAAEIEVVLGDARLTLADVPPGTFSLLVLDAFSSDAIPVHLLTVEAFRLYLEKLEPNGLIAIHLSNRYLDLEPVIAGAARALGLQASVQNDGTTQAEAEAGKSASTWAVIGRSGSPNLEKLGPMWDSLDTGGDILWTDDYSNVLALFR